MQIDILTLFPGMFASVLGESMLKRAQTKGAVRIRLHNLRDWTFDAHRSADDKPFGGGPGMVMKVEPIRLALEDLGIFSRKTGRRKKTRGTKVVLLTPQGRRLDQGIVKRLANQDRLILICGHYEGVDERVRGFVDEEISIGDYILTCGEVPAMVVVDAVTRLRPGVLGADSSLDTESFEGGLLEYPQYTRPAEFMGLKVPEVLLSGDHKKIAAWRAEEALNRTGLRRPDMARRFRARSKIQG